MIDYNEKSKADRGIFERIALFIPGYKGYREKNIRREIDRLVRSHVALSIKEAKTVTSDVKRQILDLGDIASVKSIERINTKIDTYMKSIESAESGYSGMWEAIKTTDSDLDAIVEWDEKLVICCEELKKKLEEFRGRVDSGATDFKQDIRSIENYVDELRDGLNQRKIVIRGLSDYVEDEPVKGDAEPAPAEVIEEPKKKRGLFGFLRK